jgi:adenylate kinase
MKIILIGKPGCGKGTQGKLLAEKYNIEHFSVGDTVRDILNSETHPLKVQLLNHVTQQTWTALPDELACEIVQAALSGKQSWILDGFPRNIHQAEMLGIIPDSVLYLDIPDNESLKRISLRKREDDSFERLIA